MAIAAGHREDGGVALVLDAWILGAGNGTDDGGAEKTPGLSTMAIVRSDDELGARSDEIAVEVGGAMPASRRTSAGSCSS